MKILLLPLLLLGACTKAVADPVCKEMESDELCGMCCQDQGYDQGFRYSPTAEVPCECYQSQGD